MVILYGVLTGLNKGAFDGCNKLIEVYDRSNLGVGNALSFVDVNVKNVYTPTSGESALIKNGEYIFFNERTFYGVSYYLVGYTGMDAALTLPDGVNGNDYQIYARAFANCAQMVSVAIPDSVTAIGDGAFYNCNGLTEVTLPRSVITIGGETFRDCTALKSVTVNGNFSRFDILVFSGCTALERVTLAASVMTLPFNTFRNCAMLTSITYQGTRDGWLAVDKQEYWDENTGAYTVYCTDGSIGKEGVAR